MKTGFYTLTHSDKEQMKRHFALLSNADKYLRFGTTMSEVGLEMAVDRMDPSEITGYYNDGELLAMYQLAKAGEGSYEFAVSVDARARRRGMGKTLMNMAIEKGMDLGADSIVVLHLRENEAISRICATKTQRRLVNGFDVECEIKISELDDSRLIPGCLVCDQS